MERKFNMIGNNSRYTAEYRRRVLRRRKLRAAAREIPEMLTAAATVVMNEDNDENRRLAEYCYRTQKMLLNPIVDWTDVEVWERAKSMKPIDITIALCPRCAGTNGEIWRVCCPRRLRKYSVICGECGFETKKAFTERGAIRAWNGAWRRNC